MKSYIQLLLTGVLLALFTISCSSGDSTTYYNLEVTPAPAEGGTVTPFFGEFEQGQHVELTARANEDWLFEGWRGDHSGNSAVTTITMDADKVIGANFIKHEYPLAITIEGEGEVIQRVVPFKSADYTYGTVVELRAEPAYGWYFLGWEGDINGSENPAQMDIDGEKEVKAVFERLEHPITIQVTGDGNVSQQVVQAKATEYPHGAVLELSAEPAHGWYFAGWQGDLSGSENPVQITLEEKKEVTAVFERLEFPLTIVAEGRGEVTQKVVSQPKSDGHTFETVLELTAEPRKGWKFVRWRGDLNGRENPAQITVDGEKEVTAVFEQLEYPLVIQIEGKGEVEQEEVQSKGTAYTHGAVVELTAKPRKGWRFVRWRGDLSGRENPVQITIEEEKKVTAVFELLEYPLVVQIEGKGEVEQEEVQAKGTDYTYGTVVELTAKPESGWTFARWEGDLSGSENPVQISIEEVKEVKAVFEQIKYDLVVQIEGKGEVEQEEVQAKSTDYTIGTIVELTAKPEIGWIFVRWEGDISGSENPVQITIDEEKEVIAVFEQLEYPIVVQIEGKGEVERKEVQAKGTDYTHGTVLELTAKPESGWVFARWEGDLSGSENPVQITIDEEKEVKAVFITTPTPPIITDVATGNRELIVSFDSSADDGGSAITHYEYQLDGDPNSPFVNIGLTSPFTISKGVNDGGGHYEIIFGEEYEVLLRAVTAAGPGETDSFGPVNMSLIELAENGITVMCPYASVGDTGTINGIDYEVVDRIRLDQLIDQNEDVTRVCTSLVIDMSHMFMETSSFNQNISGWDTGNVRHMHSMFEHAFSFNQDIGSWDTGNVRLMNSMFNGAESFDQDIGGWDTGNVSDMTYMFRTALSFNQDLSGWCVLKIMNRPHNFDSGTFLWLVEWKPVWGTCP